MLSYQPNTPNHSCNELNEEGCSDNSMLITTLESSDILHLYWSAHWDGKMFTRSGIQTCLSASVLNDCRTLLKLNYWSYCQLQWGKQIRNPSMNQDQLAVEFVRVVREIVFDDIERVLNTFRCLSPFKYRFYADFFSFSLIWFSSDVRRRVDMHTWQISTNQQELSELYL